ncbi:murein L,D-transpeptidase catalytic domain family protein [Bradyrhizobium sp. CB1717]|uniref:murein L,D-transpeptidase catalytic domain-containing protein n=1 Tax=Bradyrhizobium sp. CB1717 TaxID=3039154 RepID=UPI0024B2053E|nr:murein L,D-transpeptidase catalytic domain family protein [Bradyrhizobium sp. CB1717]WFU23926.1 murein L,D-transpeptidase catalytic domain family protein [Bradyrhizobium sp. CB1717]
MAFRATKQKVLNRGIPPDSFLDELIAWGRTAPDEIFAPNENADVYSSVVEVLGPWQGLPHRRAAMLEVMRVLAGFESSWDWNAGVDSHNPTSTTPTTIEAGAWQVSANSMVFGPELKNLVLTKVGSLDGNAFQKAMKRDHLLAMEYIARLLRRTVRANGPVKRHEIDEWLRRDAVDEFHAVLGAPSMIRALRAESVEADSITSVRAEPAEAGMHGFDANTKLTATTAKALKEAGFKFAIRYLSRKAKPPAKDLTADELDIILDAGLAVMAVQHVAPSGWTPSDTLGVECGGNAATHARAIGLPEKSSVWLDLEGIAAGTPASAVIAYCNAWFKEVESAGYTTGVYVGANCILSADELYLSLKTKHYWKSGSNVPDIPHRGYCMVQHIIPDDKIGGVAIDRNVTFVDAFGSAPMLVTRGLAMDVAAFASPMLAEPVAADAPAVAAHDNDEAILRELAASHELSAPMETLISFRNNHGTPVSARYWAIADFDRRSSEPRLFLFDVRDNHVQSYLCAHGKGSEGPTDDGYANVFSNQPGSNCTSLGVYHCAETYNGTHGFSMRLDGLEASNSKARARAVVVHGADYVSQDMIRRTGRIGRSDGCLAVENRYATEVVSALTGGSLVLAWYSNATRPAAARFVADSAADEVWSELEPPAAHLAMDASETTASLAMRILHSPKIVLARGHTSGVQDNATAFDNIKDTAEGRAAHRSSYGNAPGGVVNLDPRMLRGMLDLAESFSFSVSEFCGGSHNTNSRHYAGCTADINTINGQHVGAGPSAASFQQRCRELGATEVLGPGDAGHSTHIHAGWPRP